MSKPTQNDIAKGLFWVSVNLNGKCPYCFEKLTANGELHDDYLWWHFDKKHSGAKS